MQSGKNNIIIIILSQILNQSTFLLALGMYIYVLQMKGEGVWRKSKKFGFVPFSTVPWSYKMTGIPGNKCDRVKPIPDSESAQDSDLD